MRKEEKKRRKDVLSRYCFSRFFLCCGDTRHKNGDEFVVFIDERAALAKRLDQRLALDNEEPYECFPQFIIHHSLLDIRYSIRGKCVGQSYRISSRDVDNI